MSYFKTYKYLTLEDMGLLGKGFYSYPLLTKCKICNVSLERLGQRVCNECNKYFKLNVRQTQYYDLEKL